MANGRRDIERILREKSREITEFGDEVEEVFARTIREVRRDFVKELDSILEKDLNGFQRKLARKLAQSGMELLAPRIGEIFSTVGGNNLSDSLRRISRNYAIDEGGSITATKRRNGISGIYGNAGKTEDILGQMAVATVAAIIGRRQTRSVSYESNRSKEAAAQFRISRGQSQTQAAKLIAQGKRNM